MLQEKEKEGTEDKYGAAFLGILALSGLYAISLYNYLLFSTLAEMFGVIVAIGVFIVAWNARSVINNSYLLFLGISFLFVGGLDLLHILADTGTGIFKDPGVNFSSRLWVLARYIESASFLVAIFFIGRRVPVSSLFVVYTGVTAVFFFMFSHWHIFSGSFPAISALTDFNRMSGVVVSLIFTGAAALLISRRKEFEQRVFRLLLASLVAAVCTEAAFTFFVSLDGPVKLIGHFTSIFSFYFIYAAIVQTGLGDPYDLLFRELNQKESMLQEERDRAQEYLDIAEVMFVVINADEAVGLVNKKGCDFLGHRAEDMIGRNWFDFFLPERIREENRTAFRRIMDGETVPDVYCEEPLLTRGGEERTIAWHNSLIKDRSGNIIGMLSSGLDVSDKKRTEAMLEASENRLKAITLTLGEGVYILDRMGCLVFMNQEAENILGWKQRELRGREVHPLVHGHKISGGGRHNGECPILETVNSGKVCRTTEDVFVRKDGTPFPVTLVSTPVMDNGEITGSVVSFRDITSRKRTEEALRRANELLTRGATTDALTGVYNRLKFNGLLDMEIRKAKRYRAPLALIMFDIDNFKAINDEYGHQTGDSVLKEIAGLVEQNIRDADLFARWGGEEFLLLAPENDLKNAFQLAEKLRIKIESHQFRKAGKVTCSFGVTQFREEDSADSFVGRADDALYEAKENGRNVTKCR